MVLIKLGKRLFLKEDIQMYNRCKKMYLASFVIEKWKERLTSYLLEWLFPKSKREVLLRTWKWKKRKHCISLAPKQHGVLSRMQSKFAKLSASSIMDSQSKEMN